MPAIFLQDREAWALGFSLATTLVRSINEFLHKRSCNCGFNTSVTSNGASHSLVERMMRSRADCVCTETTVEQYSLALRIPVSYCERKCNRVVFYDCWLNHNWANRVWLLTTDCSSQPLNPSGQTTRDQTDGVMSCRRGAKPTLK